MVLSNYERNPLISVKGFQNEVFSGKQVTEELVRQMNQQKNIVVIDCYPGILPESIPALLADIPFDYAFCSDDCAFEPWKMDEVFEKNLTDDRVFGIMTEGKLEDYFYADKLEAVRSKIKEIEEGNILVYGTGASLITYGTICILAELARWEIQLRYRAGLDNWRTTKKNLPILSKYKRGFFIEWRLFDRHKQNFYDRLHYYLDLNQSGNPVMASSAAFFTALNTTASRPFRLVPYFDPGVWGGHWLQDTFSLPPNGSNYAWSFDGVPEENSLKFDFDGTVLETPAINLVFTHPQELLGERVYQRFGAEFPIRFDFLDTMGGQNLSLQVHPLTQYIQEKFHMKYTQDESYYILDATDDACVYLGVKENVDKDAMMKNLREAQEGKDIFHDENFVNCFPVKKHDHVLIPAGTIHCSGRNTVVLEISATPYIFTFKLWDWNRLGLDGLPRPVHLEHGAANIQWNRDTKWVTRELLHQETEVYKKEHIYVERTGLHELEPIDTYRFNFAAPVLVQRNDSVHMLNLIEGKEVTIHSPKARFEDYTVHYGETFILPEAAGEYEFIPASSDTETKVILACIRQQ